MQLRGVGIDLDCFSSQVDGLIDFSRVEEGCGEVIQCHGIAGLDVQGLLIGIDGVVQLAEGSQSVAKVCIRLGGRGADGDGFFQGFDSIVYLTGLPEEQAQVIPYFYAIGVMLGGLLQEGNCLGKVAGGVGEPGLVVQIFR
ncbi:MAG TPA: hypothetical protein VFE58_18310 [Tepidisphaeraceae bacterium]|nr:hypothetical protein [Tepidisphaeraceae bacterium]